MDEQQFIETLEWLLLEQELIINQLKQNNNASINTLKKYERDGKN